MAEFLRVHQTPNKLEEHDFLPRFPQPDGGYSRNFFNLGAGGFLGNFGWWGSAGWSLLVGVQCLFAPLEYEIPG